jgi:hypothetical protein
MAVRICDDIAPVADGAAPKDDRHLLQFEVGCQLRSDVECVVTRNAPVLGTGGALFLGAMRRLLLLCIFAGIIWGLILWVKGPSIRTAAGVVAPDEPLQEMCAAQVVAKIKDYTVTAVATYTIRARVLHTKHYWADESDLVPYDVALGWGRMSDQSVLDHLQISQGNRFYFYQWQTAPPIPQDEIVSHSSNNHLIAANGDVKNVIGGLYPGEIVTMKGYLVNVSGPKGFHWNTSLTRTDTGNGACELFYVVGIKAERPGELAMASNQ